MVDGNASMYLGSPRMAEMVIGEKVTLEEMGGAKMHCSVSGCGDVLVKTEDEAIAFAQVVPRVHARRPARRAAARPIAPRAPKASGKPLEEIIPADENKAFDMMAVDRRASSTRAAFSRSRSSSRKEIITGFARIDGRAVGIVANQPKWLGGVLFVD